MTFQDNSPGREFEFCYKLNASIDAPTEVFASATYHYTGGGPMVRTTPNIKGSLASGSADVWLFHRVSVSGDEEGEAGDGGVACVSMEKK
jgi:hypothetical protein